MAQPPAPAFIYGGGEAARSGERLRLITDNTRTRRRLTRRRTRPTGLLKRARQPEQQIRPFTTLTARPEAEPPAAASAPAAPRRRSPAPSGSPRALPSPRAPPAASAVTWGSREENVPGHGGRPRSAPGNAALTPPSPRLGPAAAAARSRPGPGCLRWPPGKWRGPGGCWGLALPGTGVGSAVAFARRGVLFKVRGEVKWKKTDF